MNEPDLFILLADKISERHNPSSWGDCNEINATIAKFLSIKGYAIIPVAGYVECYYETTEDQIYDPFHFWLRYQGQILDFASMQFRQSFYDEELNSKMNQPFFKGHCDFYIQIGQHDINNEWVRDDIINNWLNPDSDDYINC